MKQLVILSGKGGTGKASLTAAFAHLTSQSRLAERIVLADADVDAANLELVLWPHLIEQEDFRGEQDEAVTEAMVHGEPVIAYRSDAPASRAIVEVWRSVLGSLSIQNIPSSL
jgi:MinD superfamily P-loop ATPase